jgi:hypothetical protein
LKLTIELRPRHFVLASRSECCNRIDIAEMGRSVLRPYKNVAERSRDGQIGG